MADSREGSEVAAEQTAKSPADEHPRSEPTPPVPEGMSRRQWKKEIKQRKIAAEHDDWVAKRKEKRKAAKDNKKRRLHEAAQDPSQPKIAKKHRGPPPNQTKAPIKVILDCAFDDLMKEGEKVSLASQIMRCYAENRKATTSVSVEVSSFNKSLKDRFYGPNKAQHLNWTDIEFNEQDYTVPDDETERAKWLYFSSDAETTLETLEPGMTYIIGGIVDKGRYKDLCKDKAAKQNIKTAKLPIEDFIKLSGRRVLTTNHVFEIVLRWLELKDWKQAFEAVLPSRKLIGVSGTESEGADSQETTAEAETEENGSAESENDVQEGSPEVEQESGSAQADIETASTEPTSTEPASS